MKKYYLISLLFVLNIFVFTSCASLDKQERGKRKKANIIFEYGLITRRPKHYPYIKTQPDWMKSPCVRFYDVTLTNRNDIGYTILELKSITYFKDGTFPFIYTYDQEELQRLSILNYIEPYDSIVIKDRWIGLSESNCYFPAKLVDKYTLLGSNGRVYILYDTYVIE